MSTVRPRRAAAVGVLALMLGIAANVLIFAARGRGLTGVYVAGAYGFYLFLGSLILIALGAGGAVLGQRGWGLTLMLVAALFQVGYVLGGQILLRLVAPQAF